MLWQSLGRFKIELHIKYPTIPHPRERDQVIMEIVLERVYSTAEIQSINWCQGMLQCIFLSDVVTADGRYLESFVFDPGPFRSWSKYCFLQECPSQQDWEKWFEFWHSYPLTGDIGIWINPTHRKWLWNTTPTDDLYRIEEGVVHHYLPLPSQGTRRMHSIMAYTQTWKEKIHEDHVMGTPVFAWGLNDTHVNKMSTGPPLARGPQQPSDFGGFLRSWGGKWMWEGVEDS